MPRNNLVIAGAGPAGLGCAHALTEAGQTCRVIEKERVAGGLCRTINFRNYLFDIGGHRFFSKSEEINRLWKEVLGPDALSVKRLSRIHYRNAFFNYPLSFLDAFRKLGLVESMRCAASYIIHKHFVPADEKTLEGWVTKRFGKRLHEIFFASYTSKVWGIGCKDISADWAQQRIRGLSFRVAVQNALMQENQDAPKTLCDEFMYPREGAGQFYTRLSDSLAADGVQFNYESRLSGIIHDGKRVTGVRIRHLPGRTEETLPADYLFSAIPLPELIRQWEPQPPEAVLACARKLSFRSLIVVNVILNKKNLFPDQWIYVHSPELRVGRIQNYKNWSGAMVPDPEKSTLGLEYFCNEGDDVWKRSDEDLVQLGLQELNQMDILSRRDKMEAGFVVRCPNAYPFYNLDYKENVTPIRKYLGQFSNLQTMGRAGLFCYDNSDRALLTGIHAAKNYLGESFDLWNLFKEEDYLES